MRRSNRLSRSRDFDAVYRHGRSVTTRHLVLYVFVRPAGAETGAEPRLGLAVSRRVGTAAERNRLKRRLREAFTRVADGIPAERDYVLVARSGLAEAAESRGFDWLVGCVREAFELASTGEEATRS